MWALFKAYQAAMELTTPYNEQAALSTAQEANVTLRRGFIESSELTHVYETQRRLRRVQVMQGMVPVQGVEQTVTREAWVEYRDDPTQPAPEEVRVPEG